MGVGFQVDVDRLRDVSKQDLPDIIDSVNGARSEVKKASDELLKAFDGTLYHTSGTVYDHPSTNGMDGFGVADYVDGLLRDLQDGLGKLADNLDQSKAAVLEIANRYREADGQPRYPN